MDKYLYILVFAEIDFEIVLMLLMSFLFPSLLSQVLSKHFFFLLLLKVDLTAYVEKHEFCFDAVLNEHVTNDEVMVLYYRLKFPPTAALVYLTV